MELRDVRDFEQCFESNTGKTKFLIAAIENLEVDILQLQAKMHLSCSIAISSVINKSVRWLLRNVFNLSI